MYEYQSNILSIPASLLYEDLELIAYNTYLKWCQRGKLVRTKEGKGKGNTAWISFYDISEKWVKNAIKAYLGDPKEVVMVNVLEEYIKPDPDAAKFFAAHRTPAGKPLSFEKQRNRATNCMILNAIRQVLEDKGATAKMFGKRKTKIWANISEAVNAIDTKKWNYTLPGNERSLKRKFDRYLQESYWTFIHKNEGKDNAAKIKDKVADFLLAQYSLPIKLTIPEVLERYELFREAKGWPTLENSTVYNFLYQPQNERVWTIGRRDREAYNRKFKHTLTRDKSNWFPNCYWAIDGTKLDWIHYHDEASNKMGAKLKINVMFDVYSEKIIGWDVSFTESHIEHFNTIKMAVNEAQCRPYFLTYDNQGGHKMERMQTLYNSIVATNKGHHHPGKAKQHGNPAEDLFRRIQQQVINKFWFSDGQSVTVRRDDNKMNIDFVISKKSSLKTIEQLHEAWEAAVNVWNSKKHPHYEESRQEVYAHEMPMREELGLFDIMDKMWVDQKKKPITYKRHGLDFRLGDKKYQYEVYDENGEIDIEFRRTGVGKKFIVRYDPSFLDGYIQLCDYDEQGNIVHVANAEPKRQIQEVPVLMQPGDKEQFNQDYAIRDKEYDRDKAAYDALLNRTGITPEKEMESQDLLIKLKGDLTKHERSMVESNETIASAASRL